MMSFAPKFSTTFVGKKPTTTWLNDCTWAATVSAEAAPSFWWTPAPGWKVSARPSARMTPSPLLASSQAIERSPMLWSLARLPSEVIAETIATKISGATVARSRLM